MWTLFRHVMINSWWRSTFRQMKTVAKLPLIVVLRKHHFYSLLVLVNRADCLSDFSGSTAGTGTTTAVISNNKENIMAKNKVEDGSYSGNKLLLYYHQYSFYSQKVVMALHEKNLPFDSHIIDIAKDEQYESSFLRVNPRGEVPVLQDTGKIIPDSARIIDYLEDNFSNGDTPRLIPMDQGPEVRQKVTYFRNIMAKLPANLITVGAFYYPDLAPNPKIPFIAPVRNALIHAENQSSETLKKVAEQNPDYREVLLQKAVTSEKNHQIIVNKEEFIKVLDQVDEVLTKVEAELKSHSKGNEDWWLCTNRFTVADIELTILLERLNEVGLEERFWANGKRPLIEKYYLKAKERDSYKLTIPNTFFLIKTIFWSQAPLFIGVTVTALVAIIVGGVLIVRKMISK